MRARYYVFSGVEPSRDVFNALLEAKRTWENKEQGWFFSIHLAKAPFLSLSLLVSGGTLKVIEVGYILRLRCRAVAAKVIPSSWHQFSATTATSGTSGTVGKAQAPFLQNYQILRLKICQKIYTTQFSGKTILHTENA